MHLMSFAHFEEFILKLKITNLFNEINLIITAIQMKIFNLNYCQFILFNFLLDF